MWKEFLHYEKKKKNLSIRHRHSTPTAKNEPFPTPDFEISGKEVDNGVVLQAMSAKIATPMFFNETSLVELTACPMPLHLFFLLTWQGCKLPANSFLGM